MPRHASIRRQPTVLTARVDWVVGRADPNHVNVTGLDSTHGERARDATVDRIRGRDVTSSLTKPQVVLHHSLEGLTEAEARRRLVPSRTTLLGLISTCPGGQGAVRDAR